MTEKRQYESKPFKFTGEAGEYFRIWIVNLLLSIVTLGVYSAWAKVRTRQYFYRNTWVDESSFDYHADPQLILRGRLIVAALFLGIFGASIYSIYLYLGLLIAFAIALPWIAVKAYSFNARNSSFRHVRFSFRGSLGESYQVFLLSFVLVIVTLGLLSPFMQWRMEKFRIDNHRYGTRSAHTDVTLGSFYAMYLLAGLIGFVVTLAFVIALTPIVGDMDPAEMQGDPAMVAANLVLYVAMLLPAAYLRAGTANRVFGTTRVAGQRLQSKQNALDLFFIYLTNVFAIFASLGLLVPWAKVRLARYRASCTSIRLKEGWEVMADKEMEEQSALGDAASDFGDFDFGI